MGLFSFLNKNRKDNNVNGVDSKNPSSQVNSTEISENVFIEKEKPQNTSNDERNSTVQPENGINLLFQFLEKNHEGKGYDDALINPDNTHLEQNIEALKNDLERTIRKLKIYYEDFIREIDFHIGSRSRSGMIDTVEELTVKKKTAENHIKQIVEIETDAKNNKGVGQGVLISYTRGFKNGLAAISHHSIMKRTF
jgi:hypothetical protein